MFDIYLQKFNIHRFKKSPVNKIAANNTRFPDGIDPVIGWSSVSYSMSYNVHICHILVQLEP